MIPAPYSCLNGLSESMRELGAKFSLRQSPGRKWPRRWRERSLTRSYLVNDFRQGTAETVPKEAFMPTAGTFLRQGIYQVGCLKRF